MYIQIIHHELDTYLIWVKSYYFIEATTSLIVLK